MKQTVPEFGVRMPGATYVDRPGAYAIIRAGDGRLAFVRGKAGLLFLPGGGLAPGESPDDALMRELSEEIGWKARILGMLGHATQFLFAGDEGYFAIRAAYFRAELIERCATHGEQEIIWLPATTTSGLARECDAWAIAELHKACGPFGPREK